jgi:hypothetical protein
MTQDDIIRMAREALLGFPALDDRGLRIWIEGADWHDELSRFAILAYEAGVAAEREACAKVAEATVCDTHLPTGVRIYGSKAAAAIRARSKT